MQATRRRQRVQSARAAKLPRRMPGLRVKRGWWHPPSTHMSL